MWDHGTRWGEGRRERERKGNEQMSRGLQSQGFIWVTWPLSLAARILLCVHLGHPIGWDSWCTLCVAFVYLNACTRLDPNHRGSQILSLDARKGSMYVSVSFVWCSQTLMVLLEGTVGIWECHFLCPHPTGNRTDWFIMEQPRWGSRPAWCKPRIGLRVCEINGKFTSSECLLWGTKHHLLS